MIRKAAIVTLAAGAAFLISSPAEAASSGNWTLQDGVRGAKTTGTWKKRPDVRPGWVEVRGVIEDTAADSKRAYVKGVADYNGASASVHFEYEATGGAPNKRSFLINGDIASVWAQECVDNATSFEVCSPVKYIFKKSW